MDPKLFIDIGTGRLILRRFRPTDASSLRAYRALPEVARYQSWSGFDDADAQDLVSSQAELAPDTPGTWFQVAIVETASGRLIGDCGLRFLEDDHRQVEIGVTLHPDFQGLGIAAEALSGVLDYLFGTLGKHRVFAITDADNPAAVALFERLGFRREAHFVENIWFKGAYGSEYLFALLRREWDVATRCLDNPSC